MIDLTLNIHPQAMALLHALSDIDEQLEFDSDVLYKDCRIKTSALYNGRERGICLTVQKTLRDNKVLGFFFTECRNSDQLFVQVETMKTSINPPTVADLTEGGYKNRKTFQEWNVNGARNYIFARIKKYLVE
jgi:hypothetical protein